MSGLPVADLLTSAVGQSGIRFPLWLTVVLQPAHLLHQLFIGPEVSADWNWQGNPDAEEGNQQFDNSEQPVEKLDEANLRKSERDWKLQFIGADLVEVGRLGADDRPAEPNNPRVQSQRSQDLPVEHNGLGNRLQDLFWFRPANFQPNNLLRQVHYLLS